MAWHAGYFRLRFRYTHISPCTDISVIRHLRASWRRHKVKFLAKFYRFEFRVFFLLNWSPCQIKEPSLSYYLPIAKERIIGCILFLCVLTLWEMQTATSGIWTQVAVYISYDDRHYTENAYIYIYIYIYIYKFVSFPSNFEFIVV